MNGPAWMYQICENRNQAFFLRANPAKPTKPAPKRIMVAGSGTGFEAEISVTLTLSNAGPLAPEVSLANSKVVVVDVAVKEKSFSNHPMLLYV